MSRVVSLALAALFFAASARAESVRLSHRDRLYDVTSFGGSLYVVGHPGRLLRSKDGGKTFEPIKAGLGEEALFSIAFNAKGQGAVVGRSGLVLTSEDAGASWSKHVVNLDDEKPSLFSVDVLPDGTLVAVGEFGAIVRSEDHGKTWSRSSYGIEAPASSCVMEENENSDVVGEARLTDVRFVNDTLGFAVGEFGLILRTDDGGKTFARQASCTDKLLYGIATVSAEHALAVGADGAVVETKDGGRTWSAQTSGTIEHLFGVYADAKQVLIVGAAGTVLARVGEQALSEAPTGVHTWLTSAWVDERGQGVIVGGRASVLRTQDGGKTQTRIFGE